MHKNVWPYTLKDELSADCRPLQMGRQGHRSHLAPHEGLWKVSALPWSFIMGWGKALHVSMTFHSFSIYFIAGPGNEADMATSDKIT